MHANVIQFLFMPSDRPSSIVRTKTGAELSKVTESDLLFKNNIQIL